jgi:TPR repeat protein
MRRDNLQLMSAARTGDVKARWEIGRRYLLGINGFQRSVPTGIDYLTHQSVRHLSEAAIVIAENLTLHELIHFQQEDALQTAAKAGSVAARLKLGIRLCTNPAQVPAGIRWFRMVAATGHGPAEVAAQAFAQPNYSSVLAALEAMSASAGVDGLAVSLLGAREALRAQDMPQLELWLRIAAAFAPALTPELAELVVGALRVAEAQSYAGLDLPPKLLEAALAARMSKGDPYATYTLGRALCGIACGAMLPARLASALNMRKGVAALLRAGEAGCAEVWPLLHQLHAAHDTSVSNPHAALLYLEKAAAAGQAVSQRKLGALTLKAAATPEDTEKGIEMLHRAHAQNDPLATQLLATLLLPVQGTDDDARHAVERLRRHNATLASRIELARAFGLTRTEALTVNPVAGIRSWGLVVGPNPFSRQPALAASRAIPALAPEAMNVLRRSASFFSHGADPALQGDIRQRTRVLRAAFERLDLTESHFFAEAPTPVLNRLRCGSKWAFRARTQLRAAL